MATITGTLSTFFEATDTPDTDSIATIDIALCNYGSQVARAKGTTLLADVTLKGLSVSATDGTFDIELAGNDVIYPTGTYYTFTVKDGNGDIIQCNAYFFLDANNYDLNMEQPFDPSQPASPLPPLIISQLVTFAYQPNINVDATTGLAFQFNLTGDTEVTFAVPPVPGNLYTLIVQQDAAGGHQLLWNGTVLNATFINQAPNGLTIQTFVALADGNLYAAAPGTYYP
jgi:hypothetical protein